MAGFCKSADKLYGQFMPMKSGLFAVSRRFSRSEFELADEGLVATVDDELEGAGECGGQGDLAVEVDERGIDHDVVLHNLYHTSHARGVEREDIVLNPYLRELYRGFVTSALMGGVWNTWYYS